MAGPELSYKWCVQPVCRGGWFFCLNESKQGGGSNFPFPAVVSLKGERDFFSFFPLYWGRIPGQRSEVGWWHAAADAWSALHNCGTCSKNKPAAPPHWHVCSEGDKQMGWPDLVKNGCRTRIGIGAHLLDGPKLAGFKCHYWSSDGSALVSGPCFSLNEGEVMPRKATVRGYVCCYHILVQIWSNPLRTFLAAWQHESEHVHGVLLLSKPFCAPWKCSVPGVMEGTTGLLSLSALLGYCF